MNPEMDPRLASLIEKHLDGALSDAESEELTRLLEASDEAVELYLDLVDLHVEMANRYAETRLDRSEPPVPRRGPPRSTRPRRMTVPRSAGSAWAWLSAAAGVALFVGALVYLAGGDGTGKPNAAAARERDQEPPPRSVPRSAKEEAVRRPRKAEPSRTNKGPERSAEEIEAEMREAIKRGRKSQNPPPPRREEPQPEKPKEPSPLPPKPVPPAPKPTVAAVATVERIDGQGFVLSGGVRIPAQVEQRLLLRQGFQTVGSESAAVIRFPDGSRLLLEGDTTVRSVAEGREGKRIDLDRGTLSADVAKQPAKQPMVIRTPLAEATVLGTTLRITVDSEGTRSFTRLEVTEGRVRFKRVRDGRTITVASGHFAVAAAGVSLSSRRLFGPNLIADPGFEMGGKGWLGQNRGGRAIVADEAHTGVRSARAAASRANPRSFLQTVRVRAGETYEAAGWVKTQDVGGEGVTFELQWVNDLSAVPGGTGLRLDAVGGTRGTREWRRLSRRFVAPPGALGVHFFLWTRLDPDDSGTAWFDDLSLRRVAK